MSTLRGITACTLVTLVVLASINFYLYGAAAPIAGSIIVYSVMGLLLGACVARLSRWVNPIVLGAATFGLLMVIFAMVASMGFGHILDVVDVIQTTAVMTAVGALGGVAYKFGAR